jgi:hydroxyacylglutathione hydrolase
MAETSLMFSLDVTILPVLSDNYCYLVRETGTGLIAAIDPSEARPVLDYVEKRKLKLHRIYNTHHHWDHVGGNLEIQDQTKCEIYGSEKDQDRIPGLNHTLSDGQRLSFGSEPLEILSVPGHTHGHILLWFPESKKLFTGDTLFLMGCGRLFEGDPSEMMKSLEKIKRLPKDTLIYCGHEYTEKNAQFALKVDPDNEDLQKRFEKIKILRSDKKPTVPATLEIELQTNPFFRPEAESIRKTLHLQGASNLEVFTKLRELRNSF